MNNFEQKANFYDDLAQIAHKLALIAENRLPITPLERDLTLQLLRDAYLNVLQCAHTAAPIVEPEPAPEAEPVRIAEPAPIPQPEPVKVVAPESEPEPVRVVKIEPQPEPVPEPVHIVEPEPVPQPVPQPEPVKVIEPEPEPVPDILSYLEVEEPAAEPEPVAEPEPIREPEPEPEPIHPTPTPAPVIKDEPTPAPQPQVHPQPAPAELFAEEPAPTTAPQPKRSLNDLLGKEDNSLAAQFQHAHVDDLSKAISLNDKFLYIKELFKGKGEDFSKAIQKLNVCQNIDEAFQTIDMLKKYYAWDTDSSAYLALCDLVRRKFV